ncbi:glycosyltransferase [Paenibacillus senegalensis]|uniref:glycosyltransferase n=1 Tax=Paenibacillus senegalensis TaxID=1465766 RepID=UPI0002899857|nr:glycosyltransferase [Paenibacillus senegalensis]
MLILSLIMSLGLLSGMILFRRQTVPQASGQDNAPPALSVIIPARNEERNLPRLLESLKLQTLQPDEVIVIDDHSEDRTRTIAESYGGVQVISAPELPDGWTGKGWAVWNGYLQSTGDLLLFLDADVRLADNALQSLVREQQRQGGVLSVIPYHVTEKFYEKFAMLLNVLGVFAFTSPFEKRNQAKGLYGACIMTTREDYDKIGGHHSIRSEMLDDLNLGARFHKAGIKISNYIGRELISFRMYPNGFKSELEGFAKGAVLSASTLHPFTLIFIIAWILGLAASSCSFFFIGHSAFLPLFLGYVMYAIALSCINRFVGRFGIIHPLFHFLSVLFFLIVVGYSLYQSAVRRKVVWKGRYIDVGRDR